jgi:hypothetical protein
LNATIRHIDPAAAQSIDRMLDPVSRAALEPSELSHLQSVVGSGLHNAWILAGALSIIALLFCCLMPARLNPRSHAG